MFSKCLPLSPQDATADIQFEIEASSSPQETDTNYLGLENGERLFHYFTLDLPGIKLSPSFLPDYMDGVPAGKGPGMPPILPFRAQEGTVCPGVNNRFENQGAGFPVEAPSMRNLGGQFSKFSLVLKKRYYMCTEPRLTVTGSEGAIKSWC
jgi:hypothetical protein